VRRVRQPGHAPRNRSPRRRVRQDADGETSLPTIADHAAIPRRFAPGLSHRAGAAAPALSCAMVRASNVEASTCYDPLQPGDEPDVILTPHPAFGHPLPAPA